MRSQSSAQRREGKKWWKEPRRAKPTAGKRRAKPTAGKRRAKPTAGKKSIANRGKQPQDCDRDKAKHEEKHNKVQGKAQYKARVRQPASPRKHLRTDADVQQGQQWRIISAKKTARWQSAQQHEDGMTKYNEIQMDKKLRSAYLKTENKKQNVFDSESRSNLNFTVQKDTEMIHREVIKEDQRSIVTWRNQSEFSETR